MKSLSAGAGSRARSSNAVGLAPDRLGLMRAILRRPVENGLLPGLVAVVSRRGAEHAETLGTVGFDRRTPMSRDTIFRLASNTKPILAAGAMILVEECRLRLDDPVEEWLPELAGRRVLRRIDGPLDDTVPSPRSITVRDLLTFRSGYGEVFFHAPGSPVHRAMIDARLPLSSWPFQGTAEEFMKRLGALPLAFAPGERWLYHMSAEILGVLIARVTGGRLSAFLRRRLFEPLGMNDTGFEVPASKLDRFATCYRTDPESGRPSVHDEPDDGGYTTARPFESGGGGLVSTADDLLNFSRMLLNRGTYRGERILSRPAIEAMTTDQLTPGQKLSSPFFENFWASRGWGLGLGIVTERRDIAERPGRFGWDGAFGTSCYVDPTEDLIGILLTQRVPDALRLPPVVLDFWTGAYQALDD